MKNPPPVDLHGAVLYHCGPVMLKEGDTWTVKAAGPDHQQPRRAVSSRYHSQLRRPRCDRQGRDGQEDAGGAEGMRRGLSERHRRRGAILCPIDRESLGSPSDGVRHSRGDVAFASGSISSRLSPWTHTGTACTRMSKKRPESISPNSRRPDPPPATFEIEQIVPESNGCWERRYLVFNGIQLPENCCLN